MIILIAAENAVDLNPTSFPDKNSQQTTDR